MQIKLEFALVILSQKTFVVLIALLSIFLFKFDQLLSLHYFLLTWTVLFERVLTAGICHVLAFDQLLLADEIFDI